MPFQSPLISDLAYILHHPTGPFHHENNLTQAILLRKPTQIPPKHSKNSQDRHRMAERESTHEGELHNRAALGQSIINIFFSREGGDFGIASRCRREK